MKQYTYTTIECSLAIINAVTLHNNINGAAVTSNKDEECLKELLAAAHHNLRISRRIRGRPHHVQSNSTSCPIVHTRVESESATTHDIIPGNLVILQCGFSLLLGSGRI